MTPGTPGVESTLLDGVSGYVSSSEVLAIIGGSGAGKTTLLDVLALVSPKLGATIQGGPIASGQQVTQDFFSKHCAYVLQDDRLWGSLTVQENLVVAAALYLGKVPAAARKETVDGVISTLGLAVCKDVKAGNVLIKGCSGGQRRRLSIGIELLKKPEFLFLDEPTSGLDAAAAAGIMKQLALLASEHHMAVCTTVHQPSTAVFLAFDRTCLLARGRVAYLGPAADAVPHFCALLNEPAPSNYNPADYLLDRTNADFTDEASVMRLVDAWDKEATSSKISLVRRKSTAAHTALEGKSASVGSHVTRASFPAQVVALLDRTLKVYMRDPAAYIGRGALYLYMSVVFGIIYWQLKTEQSAVWSLTWSSGWGMAIPSYMSVCSLPAIIWDLANFAKERKNGQYSAGAYVLATFIAQTPQLFILTLLTMGPSYWMSRLNDDFVRFILYIVVNFTFLSWCESLNMLVGVLIPNFILAIAVMCSVLSVFFVFSGPFGEIDAIPWIMRWIYYVSPHAYTLDMNLWLVFDGRDFDDYDDCMANRATSGEVCFGATGTEVLDGIPGIATGGNFWGLGFIWGFAVLLRLVQWRLLATRNL